MWTKITALVWFPLFLLSFVPDKFGIHIAPTPFTRTLVFICLGLGTLCVLASWIWDRPPNVNTKVRGWLTLFFVLFDAWILYVYGMGWYLYGTSPWG